MKVRLAVAGLAAVLVLAGCGSTQAAAPVTSTVTAVSTVTSVVTSVVTASAPVVSSVVVDPANVAACRQFYNAMSAAGLTDMFAGKDLPLKEFTPINFYLPLQKYTQAGPAKAGTSSGDVAAAITALNTTIDGLMGGSPSEWTEKDKAALVGGYTSTAAACSKIGAWK